MEIQIASNAGEWDSFLGAQKYRPFLQSWMMGEVYRSIGEEPVRLEARENGKIVGICQAILVPARRGRHLAVLYGPIAEKAEVAHMLLLRLEAEAHSRNCAFLRISPFVPQGALKIPRSVASPLHVLAEHIWYLPLRTKDPWAEDAEGAPKRTEEEIFAGMRATARNLIRRAEKEGVTVEASIDPVRDLPAFLRLHDETRRRHAFTPYTNAFFSAQVAAFAPRNEVTLYLARHGDEVIAASIHMHALGETSYHHGASSEKHRKIPASYLLQWTAIRDALRRGDGIYNFWGIAPIDATSQLLAKSHPFSGVTLFKTGFGGRLLNLEHCRDVPLRRSYKLTRVFEQIRKWRRGF